MVPLLHTLANPWYCQMLQLQLRSIPTKKTTWSLWKPRIFWCWQLIQTSSSKSFPKTSLPEASIFSSRKPSTIPQNLNKDPLFFFFFWGLPVLCSWCSWTSWNREWPILALDSTPEPRTRGYWMNFYWMNKRINVIPSSPSVWCMVRGSCTLLKEWMNGQNSQVQ